MDHSGADAAGNPAWRGLLAGWLAATGRGPRDPEHVSLLAGRAIMLLICADVIRPSLGWLLSPATPAGLAAEMTRVRDPAGFAALAVICQENCVNSHTTQLALRRVAAILAAWSCCNSPGTCCAATTPPARTSTSCCGPRASSAIPPRPGRR